MTLAPGKRKVQSKHDIIQHAAQEKVATSARFMNKAIAFYVFNLTNWRQFFMRLSSYRW